MFLVFFIGHGYNIRHFSTALKRAKMKQKIVLATGNKGKVKEMADVLSDFGFEVVAQTDLGIDSPEETGLTFVENAILKARYAAEKSGLPAIADDSGLVVDALNGAPGLYSARYAGENANDGQNRQKLFCFYLFFLDCVIHLTFFNA